jgi:hypothetical protein
MLKDTIYFLATTCQLAVISIRALKLGLRFS